ncbi:MAG: hypothetical protein ABIY55_26395 [Kofleriaceae bacterium]
MSCETSAQPATADGETPRVQADAFEAAIGGLVPLTLALTSEIAKLAYPGAVRARHALERALAHAQLLAQSLCGVPERVEALLQLENMRAMADLMLAIAPMPSSAAVAAAEAGDPAAWHREERAWIADPLARGSSPCPPPPLRHRRDTRPDSPGALRVVPDADPDGPSRAALPAPTAAANEGGA